VTKKQFLLDTFPMLKEANIGDSRSCSFEQLVLTATQGKGVHLVLNSLADDKLQVHPTFFHDTAGGGWPSRMQIVQ